MMGALTGAVAHAIALPPRPVDRSYDFDSRVKALPAVRAQSVELINNDPVLNAAFRWDVAGKKLWRESNDGAQILTLDPVRSPAVWSEAPTGRRARGKNAPSLNKLLANDSLGGSQFRHAEGTFVLQEGRLEYHGNSAADRNYWSIDLGRAPLRVLGRDGALVAWQASPARLFYLPASLSSYVRLSGSQDSEPVAFFACDKRRAIVVENMDGGMTRFVFLRDGSDPVGYTVFDFSGQVRKSDALAADSTDCRTFYVAGSFGLVRVRYDRGF